MTQKGSHKEMEPFLLPESYYISYSTCLTMESIFQTFKSQCTHQLTLEVA